MVTSQICSVAVTAEPLDCVQQAAGQDKAVDFDEISSASRATKGDV
jgi:hypothetical protein